ncbi:MAG: hypothetical protein GY780_11695 [bacterium]|nr:hypothetical protein [bacterium]
MALVNETPPEPARRFTTRAQIAERALTRKRLFWALAMSLMALVLFVILGPDAQTVKDKFEHYGAPSEITLMPEISIEDGKDRMQKLPQTLMTPPPPSRIEIEKEDVSENGTEEAPEETEEEFIEVLNDIPQPNPDAEISTVERVEMNTPLSGSSNLIVLTMVPLEYPLGASEAERRTPIIYVRVEFFVGPDGKVSDVLANATNGSKIFENEVRNKFIQWEFAFKKDPGIGQWGFTTLEFKSPYFNN